MIVSTLRSAKYVVLLALAFASVPVSADLLANPGFEDPPFGGDEVPGAGTGWSPFGFVTRSQQLGPGPCAPISCAGAHGGTVALRLIAISPAGVLQDFPATVGESFSGGVWAINPANGDQLTGGRVGIVAIEWHGAGGPLGSAFGTTIDDSTPIDVWTLLNVSGTAPAGTIFARFIIVTNDFAGPGDGAPRFDDAFFDLTLTDTDGDGDPDVTDPDDDNDGIGDANDLLPLIPSNNCTTNDGTNATLVGATISEQQTTCASKESVDVSGTTNVGINGNLRLISEKVSLTNTSVTDNGRMEVINADPCPGCSVCGNGTLEAWEQCDDGNTDDGDGCSAVCLIEP